ncbi:hypothetical protein OIU74_016046 [Salix koriyanagi]|uniref:Uncharacterized protein n=1 Tax=Salix koriyanagi TaxID=2511006 RepID=A0A9Q0SGD1_9ROSI|nr:hypothetical protein OIU74_016046 [Salix koriyanagi]
MENKKRGPLSRPNNPQEKNGTAWSGAGPAMMKLGHNNRANRRKPEEGADDPGCKGHGPEERKTTRPQKGTG